MDEENRSQWRSITRAALIGVPVLAVLIWIGRNASHEIVALEQWIKQLGVWGPVAIVVIWALSTCLLLPDTPLAMASGALFGLVWGTVFGMLGAILGAALNFWLSRLLLRQRIKAILEKRPQWSAVERAASRQGARLQLLIRLTPLHSASVNYVMGASDVTFPAFLLGCFGLIPIVFVQVYFGYLASHVATLAGNVHDTHSRMHTAVTIVGLVASVIVMAYVTRLARRAVAESEAIEPPPNETQSPPTP